MPPLFAHGCFGCAFAMLVRESVILNKICLRCPSVRESGLSVEPRMPVIINSQEIHPVSALARQSAGDRPQPRRASGHPSSRDRHHQPDGGQDLDRATAGTLARQHHAAGQSELHRDGQLRGEGRRRTNDPEHAGRPHPEVLQPVQRHRDKKFDGLIVTGVNALKDRVEQEDFWPEVADILQWSTTNAFSSLFLCWGAKAALKFFHDIDSLQGGAEAVRPVRASAGLRQDGADVRVPRHVSGARVALEEPEARGHSQGPGARDRRRFGGSRPEHAGRVRTGRRQGRALPAPRLHPQPPRIRDGHPGRGISPRQRLDRSYPLPRHYFPGDDPSRPAPNLWRHTAHIYTNWVKAVYESTPYNIEDIPDPSR